MVVEKPFGDDLASAKELNKRLLACANEDQIYRIDHFVGKETVRNIMVTRFGNGVFEPLWSRLHIDSVQITAAETVNVEQRGAYYDKSGALKDMTPNHLFQLLAMVAMEPPNSFDADAVRAEKGRVIEAIRKLTPEQAVQDSVRGQYTAGKVDGQDVVSAYRDAKDVDPKSGTETYVALKLEVDNWRWAGVPFYLRTGKALKAHDTSIVIRFKAAPQDSVPEPAHRGVHAQHLAAPDPAQRGDFPPVRRQGPRTGREARGGLDELPLRRLLLRETGHGIRDPDLRRAHRRPDAVQPGAGHRIRLGGGAAVPGCVGGRQGRGRALRSWRRGARWRGRAARTRRTVLARALNLPCVIVMGVSGAGKSTIAAPLAERLDFPFLEGDGLHPPANVAKMHAGVPLDDADRAPWLAAIGRWIDERAAAGEGGVVACSALRRAYRDQLRQGRPQVKIVFLNGSQALIAERLKQRQGHFMPPGLLDSQFATLERPTADEDVLVIDIDQSPERQVDEIAEQIEGGGR